MPEVLSGGAAVVRALERNGVRTVFGIPGSHNLEIYRHLHGSAIDHIPVRHEQGGGYAADGYARTSRQPGVVITTTGPGLTNVCTPAATAYADSVPLLIISPGVPRGMERADVGWLHEMKDQHAHLDTLVERSVRVETATEAGTVIDEAFARWRMSRRRPVHVEIPLDVLDAPWAGGEAAAMEHQASPRRPGRELIRRAAELLRGARRPVLIIGGGAIGAAEEVRGLAELLTAPVITTVNGKGVLPETHPLSLGASIRLRAVQRFIDDADVVVVVGSELGDSDLWGGGLDPRGQIVRIDLDERQLEKNLAADVGVCADAAEALSAIERALDGERHGAGACEQWRIRAAEVAREAAAEAMRDGAEYREIQSVLRSALPEDVIVAGDSAQVSYFGTVHFWPMAAPSRFLYPTGFATLGYGVPAAIGAKLAEPSRTVVALVGDGGFMFTVAELATAVELELCLPVVVVDNSGFREIRDEMEQRGIAPLAVDRRSPDFAMLARALGGRGVQAADVEDLPALVEESLGHAGPTVISLRV